MLYVAYELDIVNRDAMTGYGELSHKLKFQPLASSKADFKRGIK